MMDENPEMMDEGYGILTEIDIKKPSRKNCM
jgi:hypothetical protein